MIYYDVLASEVNWFGDNLDLTRKYQAIRENDYKGLKVSASVIKELFFLHWTSVQMAFRLMLSLENVVSLFNIFVLASVFFLQSEPIEL